MGKQWKQCQTLFFWAPKSLQIGDCSHEIKRCLLLGRKAMTNLDSVLKIRDIAKKGLYKSYSFSSSYVWMWELEHKGSWVPKNWCFWTAVLEKTLESPLDCKKIKPVHSKGNQSWIFIGRTDAKVEAPILWPPDAKSQLIRKVPDDGEEDDREWDGLIVSSTQWTWVCASSRSWGRTGKPAVVQEVAKSLTWLSDWTTAGE